MTQQKIIAFVSFDSDTMWSIVQVSESGTLALTQQLSELRTNNMSEIAAPKPANDVSIICLQLNA